MELRWCRFLCEGAVGDCEIPECKKRVPTLDEGRESACGDAVLSVEASGMGRGLGSGGMRGRVLSGTLDGWALMANADRRIMLLRRKRVLPGAGVCDLWRSIYCDWQEGEHKYIY